MNYQYHIVYQTTNLINNMFYIGIHSTNNLEDGYLGSGTYLNRAIKKYGLDLFVRDILYSCECRIHASKIEKEIVTKEFVERKDTYNIIIGGEKCGCFGLKHSEESKKKIGLASKSRIPSEETKKKMSKAAKGRFKDPENNPMFGKKHSEETRQKMSVAAKNRNPISDETLNKMRNAQKNRSEETRKKIGIIHSKKVKYLGKIYSSVNECKLENLFSKKKFYELVKLGEIIYYNN